MTLGGLETSTLTTSIHPLYQPDRWILEKFPKQEDVCRLVQPAVKLASEVLETKPVMSFFRRIMYIILRKKGGRTCLDREEPEETNEQDVAVQQALVARAKHLRILFGVIDLNYCSKTQAHGITLVSQKWFAEKVFIRGNVDKLPADDYKTHYIVINQAYIDYAKRQRPSASAAVRFIFSLAFTIVHETGHVLYCRNFDDGNEDYNEPYFDLDQHINDEKDGELGYALENVLFKDVGNPSFIKKPALTSNGIR
ncbi:hypothetical protein CC86DRAFT_294503 [Ophiobolus disseminans]|uniref:Uncharacterized protein n=1 Tax=Ophiobolus disseminans TaxID=1469910 RepID=A0A6A6ZZR3_9PLEO|nr:hypothetical protein CC86DRAFT_294503 [Ophiobolus disseminans]